MYKSVRLQSPQQPPLCPVSLIDRAMSSKPERPFVEFWESLLSNNDRDTQGLRDDFITRLKVLLINFHAVLVDEGLKEFVHYFHNH